MAGNCAKLKWNRKRLGFTQKEFAELVGLSLGTIARLEQDETAWLTIRDETADRIYEHYDSMASWQPEEAAVVVRELSEDDQSEVTEEVVEHKPVVIDVPVLREKGLSETDKATMNLIEFTYQGLMESSTHEEFMVHIKMLKRIINKY